MLKKMEQAYPEATLVRFGKWYAMEYMGYRYQLLAEIEC